MPDQLAAGSGQLTDAKNRLDNGKSQLDDGKARLDSAKAQLDKVEGWLDNGVDWVMNNLITQENWPEEAEVTWQEAVDILKNDGVDVVMNFIYDKSGYSAGVAEYESGLAEYERARKQYEDGRNNFYFQGEEYLDAVATYEKAKDKFDEAEQQLNQLVEARRQIEEGRKAVEAGRAELEEKETLLLAGKEEFEAKRQELEDGKKALEEGKAQYEDGKAEFETKRQELEDGKKALAEGKAQYEDGKAELEAKRRELEDGKKALAEGKAQYEDGKAELEAKRRELEDGKKALEEGRTQYEDGKAELEARRQELEDGKKALAEGKAQYEDGKAELEARRQELEDGKKALAEGKAQYEDGKAELEAKRQELEDGKKALAEGKAQYEDGKAELEARRQELEDGKKALEDGRAELEAGRKEYEENLKVYEQGEQSVEELKRLIDQAEDASWILLDKNNNAGFLYCKENSQNLRSISLSFSLIFVLVGALVIFATISRMIEEHAKLVGTTKALGFFNKEILEKYLVFGMLSTMLGVILGILGGYFLLQPFILKVYSPYYTVPLNKKAFELLPTLIVIVGGVLLSYIAVRLACDRLLKMRAVALLSGESESAKRKNKETEDDPEKSLYGQLILLNMTSDLKRVIVTIVGIAGCCILLMIGFYMKFAMDGVSKAQYGKVQTYDAELFFDNEISPDAETDLASLMDELGAQYISVSRNSLSFGIGDGMSGCTVIAADPEEIRDYYHLNSISGKKEELTLPEEGVIIPKRMHEKYDLEIGSSYSIFDTTMKLFKVPVDGIFNNYFGNLVFFSLQGWQNAFGIDPVRNCFLVKLNGISMEEFQEKTSLVPGFMSLKDSESDRAQIESTASALSIMIILMIVLAAIMAYFILTNLTGSYMIHKKKELTIMRVNGFTVKECTRYAATELIISTVIGIVVGAVAGGVLGYVIIRTVEQSFLQMVRTLDWRSVVLSALITAIFSLVVNALSLRVIKDLKLTDIAS